MWAGNGPAALGIICRCELRLRMSATAHARHDTEISCALARAEVAYPKLTTLHLRFCSLMGRAYMCTSDLFNNQTYFSTIVNHIKSKTRSRLDFLTTRCCQHVGPYDLLWLKSPSVTDPWGQSPPPTPRKRAIKYFERKWKWIQQQKTLSNYVHVIPVIFMSAISTVLRTFLAYPLNRDWYQ